MISNNSSNNNNKDSTAAAADDAAADTTAPSPSDSSLLVQSLLDRLGLDVSQMDGTSLEALHDLLVTDDDEDADDGVDNNNNYSALLQHRPVDDAAATPAKNQSGGQQPINNNNSMTRAAASYISDDPLNGNETSSLLRQSSPPTLWSGKKKECQDYNDSAAARSEKMADEGEDHNHHRLGARLEPLDLDSLTPFERYVVQQLEHQNRLIDDLHRRWNEQQKLQQQRQPPAPPRDDLGETYFHHANRAVPRPAAGLWNPVGAAPPPQQQQQQQQPLVRETPEPPPPRPLAARVEAAPRDELGRMAPPLRARMPWQSLLDTRAGRIALLYWRLGRLHWRGGGNNNNNNNPDPFLLLKVIFMLAILSTKLSRSHKKNDSSDWTIKYYTTVLVVLVGFLFQTGILSYTYQFWFQRDYARRIWMGDEETVSLDQILQEETERLQHPRRGGGDRPDNDGGGGGWRQTFLLGGRVAGVDRGNHNNNNNDTHAPPSWGTRLVGILQDIFLFLASFVLSIFPMWQPAPEPQPENNNNQGGGAAAAAAGGPGVVAPPVDPTGPEEDEEGNDDGPPPAQG